MASGHASYQEAQRGLSAMLGPIVVLAIITVLIGIAAGPVFTVAMQAGHQLMNPQLYIEAVRPVVTQ